MKALSMAVGLLAAPMLCFQAYAQDSDLIARLLDCAKDSNDVSRLVCYDTLAKTRNESRPSAVVYPDVNDNWRVQQQKNPIDDSTTVSLVNVATEGESSFGRPIGLVIRCMSGATTLYINWNDYLGSEASVLTRIGTSEATRQRWPLSTDNEATFYPRDAVGFVKELMTADRLVAQVTPYNENPVTAVWNVAGLASAVEPLRKACNW
jgi:type VI secretion system protein VasI